MTIRRWSVLLLTVAALIPAARANAQTTGRIFGVVQDAQGAAVPGVVVTVSSPALQGTQTQTSDASGNFRFLGLPIGTYSVKAALAGFKTIDQGNVAVQLDQTVSLTFKLEVATRTETVTVTATPTINMASTVSGIVVGPEFFNRLAGSRDFYGVTRFAPGTTTDAVGPAFYGSSGAENQYIIEGLNTTGVELGSKGKSLNHDFIQEVEVKTGGLSAEYGRVTGGIVNVVTKSGSNIFRGSVFGFVEGGSLAVNESTRDKRPATTTTVSDLAGQWDTGTEVGGYFVKDKLWFFGAINRDSQSTEATVIRDLTAPGAPAVNSVIPVDSASNLWATKITFSAAQGHTLTYSAFGDPTTTEGAIFTVSGPESTWKGERKNGGTDMILRYDGTLGSRLSLQGIVAKHKEKEENFGPGKTIPLLIDQTVNPNALSGGFPFFQDQTFSRDVLKGDATYFLGSSHEFKGGADWEHIKAVNQNFNGGAGQRIYKLPCTGVFPNPCRAGSIPIAQGFYFRHRFYVDDRAPGYDRDNPATWQFAVPLTSEPDSHNVSFYAQDSWRAGGGLTIQAGIRWEYQDVRGRLNAEGKNPTAFSLKDNWAPRLGFIWDVKQDGRSKVYASWGRFYESIPMDINIRAFGGEVQCFCHNTSPDPGNFLPNPAVRATSLLGGEEPVDPNLKGQYFNEFMAGYEREVAKNLVVGAKFTYRNLGRVIEDFLIIDEGSYFIANPGEGIGNKMTFYDYSTVDAPRAKRKSTSFEVTARKRFSDNWQFLASAVFSKLEGNYDGTFQASTGQLDPNINSAFDYADFLVNADGRLTNDRNVQLKLDGSYEFGTGAMKGLNLGASFHWLAGTPLNAYGYSFAYANWEYYLAPRGSLGRGPADWEADLHASYPIKVGSRARLNLIADVFNLFNRQASTLLDERYNLVSDGDCAGVSDCNGDGGWATTPNTLTPLGTLSDPRNNAPNPDFLKKGTRFTAPLSLRLGVRFTF